MENDFSFFFSSSSTAIHSSEALFFTDTNNLHSDSPRAILGPWKQFVSHKTDILRSRLVQLQVESTDNGG